MSPLATRHLVSADIIHNRSKESKSTIQVSTVDAFQGGEREIIILSCVRSSGTGFMDSTKRMNVALTRAKRHLVIVGLNLIFATTLLIIYRASANSRAERALEAGAGPLPRAKPRTWHLDGRRVARSARITPAGAYGRLV